MVGRSRCASDPEILATELRDWLESGRDFEIGLPFTVGPGGALESSPTLRVQILDWLGAIHPVEAAEYARTIFAESSSADEWALALRDFGRHCRSPGTDPYYEQRILELLRDRRWQEAPTRGYLEAFDAAVHGAHPGVIAEVAQLVTGGASAAARQAAAMALDNLAGDQPLDVARVVQASPSLESLPAFRASLMARLDPREAEQAAMIRHYLLESGLSEVELAMFASSFPNLNDIASHYLLTRQPPRRLSEMAAIDLAAYQIVMNWQGESEFAARLPYLRQIENRLRTHLASAERGGMLPPESMP